MASQLRRLGINALQPWRNSSIDWPGAWQEERRARGPRPTGRRPPRGDSRWRAASVSPAPRSRSLAQAGVPHAAVLQVGVAGLASAGRSSWTCSRVDDRVPVREPGTAWAGLWSRGPRRRLCSLSCRATIYPRAEERVHQGHPRFVDHDHGSLPPRRSIRRNRYRAPAAPPGRPKPADASSRTPGTGRRPSRPSPRPEPGRAVLARHGVGPDGYLDALLLVSDRDLGERAVRRVVQGDGVRARGLDPTERRGHGRALQGAQRSEPPPRPSRVRRGSSISRG